MIVLIAPIWNFRMPAIVEGWIDKVLAPPWALDLRNYLVTMVIPLVILKVKKLWCSVLTDLHNLQLELSF